MRYYKVFEALVYHIFQNYTKIKRSGRLFWRAWGKEHRAWSRGQKDRRLEGMKV
jgi:hypothetical protein